jgi:hypothetical protein
VAEEFSVKGKLARHRKWGARQSPRNDSNSTIGRRIEFPNVCLDHVLFWSVYAQRLARVPVPLHKCNVINASLLKTQGLPTCPGAQLKRRQFFHFGDAPYIT